MSDKTLAIVLATGTGEDLAPLTQDRAKAAVPFGGKYRLIDFPLANCLHSGLRRVLVLTQYKSHSLHKHLRDGWSIFNPELGEYITPVSPQMRSGESRYTGTANAIQQNRHLLERSGARWALILSGEQIYRMDYAPLIRFHRELGGTVTVACTEVAAGRSLHAPSLTLWDDQRVASVTLGNTAPQGDVQQGGTRLVSMGIYVVSLPELLQWLDSDDRDSASGHDFEQDIVPRLVQKCPVHAYRFGRSEGRVTVDKYWRSVDTLDDFYRANMDLLESIPPINLYQDDWAIRTYPGQHPPARTVPGASGTEGICINSIVASGVVIAGGSAQHSILFPRVVLDDESLVEETILFDGVHVGERARLKNCIVEKNVRIPPGEHIGYDYGRDRERFLVTGQGIVVIPKDFRFQAT